MAFQSQIRAVDDLRGPAGRLEAVLNSGLDDAPFSAVVTHPHPLFGGTLHNKVVYHAMKAISAFGIPVLRFNFRGTGLSKGTHDNARGEVDDVRAALDWLTREYARPILFAGFSFGSYTGLRATCGDPRIAGQIALGLPVSAAGRAYTYEFLPTCTAPKLFLSSDHDEFCSLAALDNILQTAVAPWNRVIIGGANHFFQGIPSSPESKLARMHSAINDWLIHTFSLTKAIS
jgi:alpha/beta superfamily hydrolase